MRAERVRQRSFVDAIRRRAITSTLPYAGRFRLAMRAGALARRVRGLVPGAFRAMLDLIPRELPRAQALPAHYPATGSRRGRVALLAGCAQQVLAPEIGWAALRVLGSYGVEVVVPPDQGCCGALAMHAGEEKQARDLARTNLDAFPEDVDAVVTTAAGCGSGMREYGMLFRGAAEEAAATRLASRVIDVCEFLDRRVFDSHGPATLPPLPGAARVAYHDACHLAHGQGVRRAPRALLQRIPNLTLVEIPDGGYCCGSAGTYNLDQPEIAHRLGAQKAAAIRETGAEIVATGNIGCLTQIRAHLDEAGMPVRVMHTIEILDRAITGAGRQEGK
jgi:glycolate dehydrogenase iron-sulfur subunit